MSNQEVIGQLLQSQSIPFTPFGPAPWASNIALTIISHVGLNIDLQIHNENLLLAQLVMGYLPNENVAPVMRHLLEQNSTLIGLYYCVLQNKAICLRFSRQIAGLDAMELRLLLDGLCSTYWQHAQVLQKTYQLPLSQ